MHIFRWDLDRTYLETDIDSVRGLLRAALEAAADKRNVPGSAALMRGLRDHDPGSRVHILSGSPTQLRPVIEEKLAIDGVRIDQLVLKDNLGNLRRGRLRAVRGQVGYKLPRLLQDRVAQPPEVRETLFGDDAETDALIYALYADVVSGRVEAGELARVLEASNAYPDAVERALRAAARLVPAEVVEDAFIHLDRGRPLALFDLLGDRVTPVFSWYQAALLLRRRGRLGLGGLVEVARACSAEAGIDDAALAGLGQDLVRRALIGRAELLDLLGEAAELGGARRATERALVHLGAPPVARPAAPPDWTGFLHAARRDR